MTDPHSDPSTVKNPGVRYERKDIRLRWLVIIIVGVCCYAVIHFTVVMQLFRFREGAQEQASDSRFPPSKELPRQPRLEQIDRLADVKSSNVYLRLAAQEKVLNSYGPTDDKGFVHIPIREAIQAVAGQLPVRKEPAGGGEMNTGESNSGRTVRGK